MNIEPVHCPSCLAVVDVSPDMDRAICEYCGTTSIIEYSEGQSKIRLTKEITGLKQALQQSNQDTVQSIQLSNENTQRELQHLRLTQELSVVEMRLGNVQAEISTLERTTDKKVKKIAHKRIISLQQEKKELNLRRTSILDSINALYPVTSQSDPNGKVATDKNHRGSFKGCLSLTGIWFISFLVLAVIFGSTAGDPVGIPTILSLFIAGYVFHRRRKKITQA